ncbi:MAG: replicative DNA helicase [Oscillospiraceae bacterium]|nr:replicative DNA helicase [Oscillospiraceae bacterium]
MEFNSLGIPAGNPPYSLEAEQTVIGAVLIDPEVLSTVITHVKPESFYVAKHRDLFAIILRQFALGTDTDVITVLNEAVREDIFESSASGKEYLAALAQTVPTTKNIESYCKIVEEKYCLRQLITAARDIIDMCADGSEPASTLLDFAEQKIYDIRQGKDVDGLTKIDEVIIEAYDELERKAGPDKELYASAKSGFSDLDHITSGLNKSDLIVLAARPAMGKTAFALNMAANICRNSDKEVVIFSLEMSKEQLVTRMLSSESKVNSDKLMKGSLKADDWSKLAEGAQRLSQMNIYLDDTAGVSAPQMKAKLRRLKNVALVIIDYLQLMSLAGRRTENRVAEISEITRQLKLMAKELNIPVLTLSQLSRSVESRSDKHPVLSDLRDSGSIEQDADIVMFLYRDGYYNPESPDPLMAECIVSKNRHGETGTINLRWNGQYTLFLSESRHLSEE